MKIIKGNYKFKKRKIRLGYGGGIGVATVAEVYAFDNYGDGNLKKITVTKSDYEEEKKIGWTKYLKKLKRIEKI